LRGWANGTSEVLGIDLNLGRGTTFDRSLGSDSLVLRFFDRARSCIGDPEHQNVMVSHVVDDLDGFLDHVRECGVDDERVQVEPYGRFSWATDLEGNRLWEPNPVETTD